MARIEADQLYTLDEAAELLHVSRRTVQRHTRSGRLPARLLGRRVYIVGHDLLNLPAYRPLDDGDDDPALFTLGELAADGNLAAMAKMLNDAGADPRFDEIDPSADAPVHILDVADLVIQRGVGDPVGYRMMELLREARSRSRGATGT